MIRDLTEALAKALPEIPILLGPEHLSAHAAPPRIVVVPSRDRFEAPRQGRDGRSVRTRILGLDVHFWGRDLDYSDTEAMIHAFLFALDSMARTSCEIVGGTWVDAQAAPWLQHGRAYVLLVTFDVPVVRGADADSRAVLDAILVSF